MSRLRARACGLAVLLALGAQACAATPERIVQTAAGRHASASEVDGDPWRLLPGGAVTWARFDTQALAQASFGPDVNRLLVEHLPFAGPEDFDLARDVDELVLGIYSTAGADVAAVARGRFDAAKIAAAIAKPSSASGRPIQANPFAGQTVYVADGWAMVPVTSKTLVLGTEVGVRRVLERIEESRLTRSLPRWFEEMLAQPAARFAVGIDLDAQPVPSVVRTRLTFLEGLRAGRLLGNFEEPGLNVAGTLTYDSPETASRAAQTITEQNESLRRVDAVSAILGIPRLLRRLEARPTGKDTQLVLEMDARVAQALLKSVDQLLDQVVAPDEPAAAPAGAPATPAPAGSAAPAP